MINKEFVKSLLATISIAYPNYKPSASAKQIVELWYSILGGVCTADEAGMALKAYISSPAQFAPSPGQILEIVRQMRAEKEAQTSSEAWAAVVKALRKSGTLSGAKEAYAELSPITRKVLGDAGTLYTWSTSKSFDEVYAASAFEKSYEKIKEIEAQKAIVNDAKAKIGVNTPEKIEGGE